MVVDTVIMPKQEECVSTLDWFIQVRDVWIAMGKRTYANAVACNNMVQLYDSLIKVYSKGN